MIPLCPPVYSDNPFDEAILVCPECGTRYTSLFDAAVVIDSKDDYKAHPKVRGNVIALPGRCQNGHRFSIFFGSHKGFTVVWVEMLAVTE